MISDLDPDDFDSAMGINRRQISAEKTRKFEGYVSEIFTAFGMDPDTESTRDTPKRFIKALFDATEGYDGDPKLRLSQVVEGPIHFYSFCEHHVLPFYGRAYVGYIAHEGIIGISKLTRLVRLFAKRFTVQERIGEEIANGLQEMLQPHGVAVYLEAYHLCTQMRGVREVSPTTRTTFWRGAYDGDPALRAEFYVTSGLS